MFQDFWIDHIQTKDASETVYNKNNLTQWGTYPVWHNKKGTAQGQLSTGGVHRDHQVENSTTTGFWTRGSPLGPGWSEQEGQRKVQKRKRGERWKHVGRKKEKEQKKELR